MLTKWGRIEYKNTPATIFKYLGSIFTEDGWHDQNKIEEQYNLLALTTAQIPKYQHRNQNTTDQQHIHTNSLLWITDLITKVQERKVIACEIRCHRRAVNVSRRERLGNDSRKMVLAIACANNMVKISWISHLM